MSGVTAPFTCTERVAAGQFTIPEEVLLTFTPDSADHSELVVTATSSAAVTFRASGLDIGRFSYTSFLP